MERVVADLGERGITVTRLILTPTALAPEAAAGSDPDAARRHRA